MVSNFLFNVFVNFFPSKRVLEREEIKLKSLLLDYCKLSVGGFRIFEK